MNVRVHMYFVVDARGYTYLHMCSVIDARGLTVDT